MDNEDARRIGTTNYKKQNKMKTTERNYAQFYVLLGKLPGATEGLKEELVLQFTNGRTSSLKEMTETEYRAMCASLRENVQGLHEDAFAAEIKRRRSAVLKRVQRLGVDTTNWAHVDNFCMSPKIAGKRFAKLSIEELAALIPKLENMLKKSGRQSTDVPIGLMDRERICRN
jgi:hypothetical protein